MRTVLAIESSGNRCSVALFHQGCIREQSFLKARQHNQVLLPTVERLLAERGLEANALEGIIVSAGPGSFTGLRISIAMAQALAFAADCPTLPVSSLHCLAQQASQSLPLAVDDELWVVEDARMGDVFVGRYYFDGTIVQPKQADQLYSVEDLGRTLVNTVPAIEGTMYLLGNRAEVCSLKGVSNNSGRDPVIQQQAFSPSARALLVLAAANLPTHGIAAAELEPIYLREEIAWKKWQSKAEKFQQSHHR